MTYTPTLGQDALMVVTVVREEHSEDGVTGVDEYIVECPNGTETIATSGHLIPRLSTEEWEAIRRVIAVATDEYLADDCGRPWQPMHDALAAVEPIRHRLGWA
jgi:hypothetical protein